MKLVTKSVIILSGIFLVAVSCRQAGRSEQVTTDQEMVQKSEIDEDLKEIVNPLPEPFEVYSMLEDIGASYLGKVLNPVDHADRYFSQKSKAVNIGVYAADLGYAATYNKQDDIKTISKTLKSLVDDLGISVDYSMLQDETAKAARIDKDTLIAVISDVYYDTYSFLYKESTPELSALMAAGAWTEGVFIATHISDDTFNNTDIVEIIYDQSKSLGSLIEYLEKFSKDEMVLSLTNDFKKLKEQYDATEGSLTKEQLEDITSTIETIRDSIIS
jgi:hypothetical protein